MQHAPQQVLRKGCAYLGLIPSQQRAFFVGILVVDADACCCGVSGANLLWIELPRLAVLDTRALLTRMGRKQQDDFRTRDQALTQSQLETQMWKTNTRSYRPEKQQQQLAVNQQQQQQQHQQQQHMHQLSV